jgi:hypothetical protein
MIPAPPGSGDETVRITPGRGRAALPPETPGEAGAVVRRALLVAALGAGALGVVAAALMLWPTPPPPPQRLGPRRLVPPLVRATLRGEDRVYALARRAEQDETDPPGAAAPRDRIELLCLAADDLAPRFAVHLVSVPRGGLADAALIAEQGATLWLWLGRIGAVSAVDGQVLADAAGLAELNPDLADALSNPLRGAFRLGDALVIEAGVPRRPWRFDPRDFLASPAGAPPPRPLPRLNPAAGHGPGGNTAFRAAEALLDGAWFGLPNEDARLVSPLAPRSTRGGYLPTAALPMGGPQQLWRGRIGLASAAPPGWPANRPDRWGQAERLLDLARVPGVAGVTLAGFLTAGAEAPVALAPPGLLVLHGEAGSPLGLLRLGPYGAVAWRAVLPITRLRSVLPGTGPLVLVGWRSAAQDAEEVVLSVALDTGAVTERGFSA